MEDQRQPLSSGEYVGKAWQAVLDRLPDGWVIDRLELLPHGMWTSADGTVERRPNIWWCHARPFAQYAWKRSGFKHLKDGVKGQGLSAVEALLSLGARLESGENLWQERPNDRNRAVNQLLAAVFPSDLLDDDDDEEYRVQRESAHLAVKGRKVERRQTQRQLDEAFPNGIAVHLDED